MGVFALIQKVLWVTSISTGAVSCILQIIMLNSKSEKHQRVLFFLTLSVFLTVLTGFSQWINMENDLFIQILLGFALTICLCFIIITAPNYSFSRWPINFFSGIPKFFMISGFALLFFHLLAGVVLVSRGEIQAPDSGILILSILFYITYLILILAVLYSMIHILKVKTMILPGKRELLVWRCFAVCTLFFLPFFIFGYWGIYLFPDLDRSIFQITSFIVQYIFYTAFFIFVLKILHLGRKKRDTCPFELTSREFEVAGLLAKGLTYKQISEKLFISLSTVQTHVKHIYVKTGSNNKLQLKNILQGELF